MRLLRAGAHAIDVSTPRVMGVVNVTSDSFSDVRRLDAQAAIAHARRLVRDGAAIIDVGGESTRPNATPVDEDVELGRVVPIVAALAREGVCVSVDTMKPAVMRAAIAAGASMINDVRALQAEGALEVAADSDVAVCLMHMQGEPRTMQQAPAYRDVVAEVRAFLGRRAHACIDAGIAAERIVIDPGFGFGKSVAHNLDLLRHVGEFGALGFPVLVGLSRKSMIGALTGREIDDRQAGSIAAALLAALRGARILRVHDVRATVDALAVWQAVEQGRSRRDPTIEQ
ncbi:MAG TPA: dihydropteroate synthase [Casimicrobiaceae bacterium]|nr:dihydropteroate synthase [Casimicrobiaceae bacterium]